MDDLQELVAIFRSRGLLKHIKITGDKKRKLYNGLLKNKYKSENDAIIDIYGSLNAKGRFAVLKTELRKNLLTTLISLDPKYFGSIDILMRGYRNECLSLMLLTLGASNVGLVLGNKAVEDFEFAQRIDLQLPALNERTRRAGFYGTQKKLISTYQELRRKLSIYEAEVQMEHLYLRLLGPSTILIKNSKQNQLIAKNFEEANNIWKQHRSYNIDYNYYNIAALYYESVQEYSSLLNISQDAIKTLDNYNIIPSIRRNYQTRFSCDKIHAHLFLKDYAAAEVEARDCCEHQPKNPNWYAPAAYLFLTYTLSLQFDKAHKILNQAMELDIFKFQAQRRREQWSLYQLCLELVKSYENLPSTKNPYSNIKNIEKQVSSYTIDKTGVNAFMVIIHILFLLAYQQYNLITDRIDVLKTHYQRYIKSVSPSLSLLLKLIFLIEKKSFSYQKVITEAQRLRSKYTLSSITATEFNEGIAILPYDWLFDKTLEILKKNNEEDAAKNRRLK